MSEQRHFYKVFGLIIRSNILLPELISVAPTDKIDLDIKTGTVVFESQEHSNSAAQMQVSYEPGSFYLELKEKARFRVSDEGRIIAIIVDIVNPDDMNTILSWFYGSVLTAAMQMKNRFALHASAVMVNGRLHLFCGPSGIGKSTLAAQLHSRNYNAFTDDKCVLYWDKDQQEYLAEPAIQIMRLWEDATDNLTDIDFLEDRRPVVNRQNKFQYLVKEDVGIRERKPIERIYVIKNMTDDWDLEVTEPTGFRKAKMLRNQTHRLQYIKGLNKTKEHWEYMDGVVKNVPIRILWRPRSTTIHDFVDFVENEITNPLV